MFKSLHDSAYNTIRGSCELNSSNIETYSYTDSNDEELRSQLIRTHKIPIKYISNCFLPAEILKSLNPPKEIGF